ncbi:MAG: bifunctional 3-deoxy-7-phosphoheptulonate synthase/chorismate mutase [Myxococcota bacterium]|nr:bifunctional 3-deoxy-7-phosphoheptulonate synthase/chorismate mutase [Myxococcota bacterium]
MSGVEKPPPDPSELASLRAEIDRCDEALMGMLAERARLALRAREIKEKRTEALFDGERQAQMLTRLVRLSKGPLSPDAVVNVFKAIYRECLGLMHAAREVELRVHRRNGEPDRVLDVAGRRIGERAVYVAGPCAVESFEQLDETARFLRSRGVGFLRGGTFKPRTSPYVFQGLGMEGLRILREVGRKHGMATVTEITDPRLIDAGVEHADVIQIGARNMMNYDLLREAGRIRHPVLLKRGYAATIDEYLLAAEYIVLGGNDRLILCERGIRTFMHETRNTLDLSGVALLRQQTPYPVLVDASHAAGRRDILGPLVRAAFAAGASGVMLEVHPCPAAALSDSNQQLSFEQFSALQDEVNSFAASVFPVGR